MSKLEERRKNQEKQGRKNSYIIGVIVLIIIVAVFVEKLFQPTACECAKLISRNGFITYGDLQSMKNLSSTNGSAYKEMEKTYNCGEWYDYDDLKDCNTR